MWRELNEHEREEAELLIHKKLLSKRNGAVVLFLTIVFVTLFPVFASALAAGIRLPQGRTAIKLLLLIFLFYQIIFVLIWKMYRDDKWNYERNKINWECADGKITKIVKLREGKYIQMVVRLEDDTDVKLNVGKKLQTDYYEGQGVSVVRNFTPNIVQSFAVITKE